MALGRIFENKGRSNTDWRKLHYEKLYDFVPFTKTLG
jgi:hypothetical protein